MLCGVLLVGGPAKRGSVTVDAWVTLAVVVITVGVLIVDRFDPALVMGGAVLALYVSGVIDSGQLLAGVANESLAIVAAPFAWWFWIATKRRARRRSAYDVAVARLARLTDPARLEPAQVDAFFVELSAILVR